MKRFAFRLESLLTMKKQKEDAQKLRLAEKNREVADAKNGLQALHRELTKLQLTQKKGRAQATSVQMLKHEVTYRHALKADMLKSARTIEGLEQKSEEVRLELVQATKERKAIEMLKDKKKVEWKKEYNHAEQEFIDDVAQKGPHNGGTHHTEFQPI